MSGRIEIDEASPAATTPPAPTFSGRNNNFNVIRLAAASAVIFSHAFDLSSRNEVRDPLFRICGYSLSWYAVSIFFMVSGYLIVASWERRPHLRSFLWARFLRIWPALALVTTLAVFVLGPLATDLPIRDYFGSSRVLKHLFGGLSILGIQYELPGVFTHNPFPAVNGSLWSLRYEITCYFVVAAAGVIGLLATPRRRLLAISVTTVVIGAAFLVDPAVYARIGPKSIILIEGSRLGFAFALGALVRQIGPRLPLKGWIVLAGFAISATVVGTRAFPLVSTVACAYATFWFAFAVDGPILHRLRAFPDYSYGVYLYGFPVQQLMLAYLPPLPPAAAIVVCFIGTLPLAALSWHLLEEHALKLKALPSRRRPRAA